MATFAEIAYAVLDILKEHSDDAYYTEEHVLFLAKKIRAVLLERKYRKTRNGTHSVLSDENKQQVCMQLEKADLLPGDCDGLWLRSTAVIPELLAGFEGVTCTAHDLLFTNVTFISQERMPYIGYNKWLKNIIYASRSVDGHLYLHSNNPQFVYLEQAGLTGVFADPEAAARLSHEACMNGGICNMMEQKFPLEASLVPSLIEMIVQELIGSRYAPEDKGNNAKDDLGDIAVAGNRHSRPVENSSYKPREEQEA